MRPVRALLNTANDGLRLGRCLVTLHPCDEIVIVDHGSTDDTRRVARQYGAKVVGAAPGCDREEYRRLVWPSLRNGWILCLEPCESLSESLAASLFEWKTGQGTLDSMPASRSIFLREETSSGWTENPVAQTRLVFGNWNRWAGFSPRADESSIPFEGALLRFAFP